AVPKVSSGCTLDDDDIETIVVPKKARIETSLNISGTNSAGDLPENIILVDEDEEREMNNRSGAEMPSKERFMDLWKKELEQCNHILNDEYFHPKYYPMLTGPQLSSACAVVGARVAQEAIKVLSHRDEPLQNVFFYSALDSSGILCRLPPDI
ncbi:unnamed protein product, partial [Gongylonema pulchrum]|uniref:ThiF domain-containing protein n=1 Tax=Gongylonema pulchrum TaxID=637853 RepID=A0A183E0I5_9BILA